MATRTRASLPGKEKRGTSPSQPQLQLHRTSPTTSRTSPSAAADRPVPNYLKPTRTTGTDASKQQGKKPVVSDDQKPSAARRRSLDKPKPHVLPNSTATLRSTSFSGQTVPKPAANLRSSSFTGKTAHPPRQTPDKNMKAIKESGKQDSLHARPVNTTVKRKTMYVKKQGSGATTSTKEKEKLESSNAPIVAEHTANTEERVTEQEEEHIPVDDVSNQEHKDDDPGNEIQEVENVEKTEAASSDKDFESLKVQDKHDASPEDVKIDGYENREVNMQAEENHTTESETITENSKEEVEEKDVEVAAAAVALPNVKEEDDVHVVATDDHELKEVEVQQAVKEEKEPVPVVQQAVKEEKEPVPVIAQPKQHVPQVKKDAVSNGVIEETASKLREQRQNKVKALAGAFETVISLQ